MYGMGGFEMNREAERKRLVELLKDAERKYLCNGTNIPQMAEFIADHLLDDGWMRPPVKVGQIVYEIDLPEYGIIVCKVTKVFCDSREVIVNVIDGHGKGSEYYFDFDDFGKTVFTSREDALKALEGKEDEGK